MIKDKEGCICPDTQWLPVHCKSNESFCGDAQEASGQWPDDGTHL